MPYLLLTLIFILILLVLAIFYFKFYNKNTAKIDSYINKDDSVLIRQDTGNNNIIVNKPIKKSETNPFDEQINELNITTSENNIINKQELESFQVDEYEVEKNKKYIPYKPKYKLQENI